MVQVLLGSQSPRRQEILSYFSLPFEQVSPPFSEAAVPFEGDPRAFTIALARGKAETLLPHYPDSILITADTIVFHKRKVYGKPAGEKEAIDMLTTLSGTWHSVFTGIVIMKGEDIFAGVEETKVLFNTLSSEQIEHYYRNLPCEDKAGSYYIQKAGSIIVNKIEGCYYNVMGLPINTLRQNLLNVGVDLWDYLSS